MFDLIYAAESYLPNPIDEVPWYTPTMKYLKEPILLKQAATLCCSNSIKSLFLRVAVLKRGRGGERGKEM